MKNLRIEPKETNFLEPKIIEGFIQLLESKNTKKILKKIKSFHASEIAAYLQILNYENRKKMMEVLKKDFDSQILVELKPSFLEIIIDEIDFNILAKSIKKLNSDDAVSIIEILNEKTRHQLLPLIPLKYRDFIEENLNFSENSAGKLMQFEVVKVSYDSDIGNVIDYLRRSRNLPKVFYEIYVTDDLGTLIGTVSVSQVLTNRRSKKILDIMQHDQFSVHVNMDQEDVADLFRKRNLTSAAVVNDDYKLLGSIYVDDIVDVIDNEAEEDLLKLGGVGEQNFYDAVISVTKARFTWLMFNLIAAFIASFIIKNFEHSIEKLAFLAALMPIVASMGGCSGTQSLTTAVRAIAMKQLTWSNAFRTTGKEITVGVLNGIVFSFIAGLVTYLWFNDYLVSLVISTSLMLNLVFGAFFGTFIPIILTKYGIDPALASGTFVTMLTDIFGFFMFLSLATFYLI